MSEAERSPLLSTTARSSKTRSNASSESTPLLGTNVGPQYGGGEDAASISPSLSTVHSLPTSGPGNKNRRWPSIIAITILGLFAIGIIVLAFFVPAAVEQYAKEAAVLQPTNLSLESITTNGVRARVQANFRLDGSRVKDDQVRRVGRLATWIVRQLGTEETRLSVYLPDYGQVLLGTAAVPPLVFNIMDGHNTAMDFVADLAPGDGEGIRTVANEWLRGQLGSVRLRGIADIRLKSGIFPLGTHTVSESLLVEATELPQVPQYNVTRLNFRDTVLPGRATRALAADVAVAAFNSFPVQLDIPELAFDVVVPNCAPSDPFIPVAYVQTSRVAVQPQSEVAVEGHGVVEDLPESLTTACPPSQSSPLDVLLKHLFDGDGPTVFVRGAKSPLPDTPEWVSEILSSVIVPVPFPGSGFNNLIREFSVADVHFSLPDPMAEPDDPASNPRVSGIINVSAALPSEMNFEVNVTAVRAAADVLYESRKLGELNLREWQPANSTRVPSTESREARLAIQSRIVDAPLDVTDGDVLADVIEQLLFRGKQVNLNINAAVDVKIETGLGNIVLKDIPAQGKIPVKPALPKKSLANLDPKIERIRITDTAYASVSLEAVVNVSNPTPYTASIPCVNLHLLSNGSVVGDVTAENLSVSTGINSNVLVNAKWNPAMGGEQGERMGRDLISKYLSGYNTTITFRTHRDSIPSLPLVGEALSRIDINVSAPRLKFPGKNGDDSARFIRDATFHVFSSTATFTLLSPLEENVLYIEMVNATAFYNHTEPVATIKYDLPFAATPGESQTPRLPVEWSLGSDGYQKLKNALGGTLKLDAKAVVGVRLGGWREIVWYEGHGIGASIQL